MHPRSGKRRRQTTITIHGCRPFRIWDRMFSSGPKFDHGLPDIVLFCLKMHSGDPKNVIEFHIVEAAPMHRIGEKIDQIRVLVLRV